MRIKKNKNYIFTLLLVLYFSSKIAWDYITFDITEYLSLLILGLGFVQLMHMAKRKEIELLVVFILF